MVRNIQRVLGCDFNGCVECDLTGDCMFAGGMSQVTGGMSQVIITFTINVNEQKPGQGPDEIRHGRPCKKEDPNTTNMFNAASKGPKSKCLF